MLLGLNILLFFPNSTLANNVAPKNDEEANQRLEGDLRNPSPTFLPRVTNPNLQGNYNCTLMIKRFEEIYFFETSIEYEGVEKFKQALIQLNSDPANEWGFIGQNDVLGCAIVTGRIKLAYLGILMFYVLKVLTVFSGIISMVFIMIGGYRYIIGALTESKDEGKKTIIYAIAGLIVSTLAWIIVDIVQTFVTG